MEENDQLNENATHDDTVWLHEFRDRSSVTRTQMCSLQVPTTTSCSNRSCNGPAAAFNTRWTRYGSFGKLEISHELSEPRRKPDAKEFCGERNSVTLYKHKQKRHSIALRLLRENTEIATAIDVPVSKEQNVAQ